MDLASAFEVCHAELGHEFDVIFWRECEGRLLPPNFDLFVFGITGTIRDRHIRNVGYAKHQVLPINHDLFQ